MPDFEDTTRLVDRLRAGDPAAAGRLIAHTRDRLRARASQMLRGFPGVRRWEQTDDVLHEAVVRLGRALAKTQPESARHYYNLATLQIRRELLDLADHYQGPLGLGANHQTDPTGGAVGRQAGRDAGPATVGEWADLHRAVAALPDEQREVVDLLWYQGLEQVEAARVLGASVRTVKRRWQAARLTLADRLGRAG